METIKAEEVEKTYQVHWECPDCRVSNTDEEDDDSGSKEAQCWECQTKVKLLWGK